MSQESDASSRYHVPRLLAFYQDLWDDDGTPIGWKPIAWGLRFGDGSAVSVNIEGKPSVTLWHSVEDALAELDAYVDTPEPRGTLDERIAVPAPAVPQVPGTAGGPRPRATPDLPDQRTARGSTGGPGTKGTSGTRR